MPIAPPQVIGHGAEQMKLVCSATFDTEEKHLVQGSSLAGLGPREIGGLAIFEGDSGFYLFTCDREWRVMFDTWHETAERALSQAEYEHSGITGRWKISIEVRKEALN